MYLPNWLKLAPQSYAIITIILFALVTRIILLSHPIHFYFDEVYHGITVQLIAQNDPRAFEWWHPEINPGEMIDWLHPPFAKYTQAIGILVFGDTSFGWRISSALFGVGVVAATFLLGKLLFNNSIGLLAATLVSLDGLILVQSRIAMNDIHVTFFIVAAVAAYVAHLKYKYSLVYPSILIGLAIASKWSGIFILLAILLHAIGRVLYAFLYLHSKSLSKLQSKHFLEYVLLYSNKIQPAQWLSFFGSIIKVASIMILIPAGIYLAAYIMPILQGKSLSHLVSLHQQIWWYQTSLTATHTYQSRPWEWFLNLRPVWFYVDYSQSESLHRIGNIYAFGNPVVHIVGALSILFLVSASMYHLFRRNWHYFTKEKYILFILFVYGIVWLPWVLSPRILFYYHYTPAVPFLAICTGYVLTRHTSKKIIALILTLGIAAFIIWYPHWTGIPVPEMLRDLYFIVPRWK